MGVLPEIPEHLRAIGNFVRTANEYREKDTTIYYWTLYHAAMEGMHIDSKSDDAKAFLNALLNELERVKRENPNEDAIKNDVVAQSYIESHALRLFNYADTNDRQGNFNKNVVKAFYAAGNILDVLTCFGTPDDALLSARKYAKWKATYIHGCLKRGEQPVPGPPPREDDQAGIADAFASLGSFGAADAAKPQPPPRATPPSQPTSPAQPPPPQPGQPSYPSNIGWGAPPTQPFAQPPTLPNPPPPAQVGNPFFAPEPSAQPPANTHIPHVPASVNAKVKLEDFIESRKLCKMACSALDYEDARTAIEFLEKALAILRK